MAAPYYAPSGVEVPYTIEHCRSANFGKRPLPWQLVHAYWTAMSLVRDCGEYNMCMEPELIVSMVAQMVATFCEHFFCKHTLFGAAQVLVNAWYAKCEVCDAEVAKCVLQRGVRADKAFDFMDSCGGTLLAQRRGVLDYTRLSHVPEIALTTEIDLRAVLAEWQKFSNAQKRNEFTAVISLARSFPAVSACIISATYKTLRLHEKDLMKQLARPDFSESLI
jgi:hypothetical protein